MTWLIVIIFAGLLARWGMGVGIYPVLTQLLVGAVAVTTGAGFARPLHNVLPWESEYLFGSCMGAIAVATYLLIRMLMEMYMPMRDPELPEYVDRLGGLVSGFLTGLMLAGFACLVFVKMPLPTWAEPVEAELNAVAKKGVFTVQLVGLLVHDDELITMDTITADPPGSSEERTVPATGPSIEEDSPSPTSEPRERPRESTTRRERN